MAVSVELCVLSFLLTVTSVYGGDYCFTYDGDLRWCSYGCCGYLDRDCCSANIALIVGLTVLAILVVSGAIALCCCCWRRQGNRGQVINNQPPVGPGGVVVSSGPNHTTVTTMGQPMPYHTQAYQPGAYAPPPYPMGPQPPQPPPMGYGAAMAPPPYNQVAGGMDNQGYKPPN